MRSYEVLPHTADTAISTRAESLEAVIGNAAFAMFDLMYGLDEASPATSVQLEVAVASPPDLLVSVLSELLYHSEVEDLAFAAFEVRIVGDHLLVDAAGVPVKTLEWHGPPIKAVTYHDLICEEESDGVWHVQVIFDV